MSVLLSSSFDSLLFQTWPVPEDAQTTGNDSYAHSQSLHASAPEEPVPQGELKPGVTTITIGKPPPSHQLHLQSTSARPQSPKIAAVSSMTPPSGHSVGSHLTSGSASVHVIPTFSVMCNYCSHSNFVFSLPCPTPGDSNGI